MANAADPDAKPKVPPRYWKSTNVEPLPVGKDPSVKYDYPIVYVRAPRLDRQRDLWPNVDPPLVAPVGSELMLLHPDGREEVLVPVKPQEAITDPFVSFDGEWVYYAKFYDVEKLGPSGGIGGLSSSAGSDVFKIHVPTRKVVQLTRQEEFAPNSGPEAWAKTRQPARVFNLAPCPAPGGKIVFVSDRFALLAVRSGQERTLQMFVMDENGSNVECIGHLNLGSAMHPVILADGRIMFTTNERQGLRAAQGYHNWGLWSIHPDGTNWGPLVSSFVGDAFHSHTQLSNGDIVVNYYYPLQGTKGFGALFKFPAQVPPGSAPFGSARGEPVAGAGTFPFRPYGFEYFTRFAEFGDVLPNTGLGMVNHPSGVPDNHLLCIWGGASGERMPKQAFDSGIYLIKGGKAVDEPGEMLLIKNDPKYHEMFPRALVSYRRIYGVEEPKRLTADAHSPHLPTGTPFGLVGTSSLYKRESYPGGTVPPGKVTATYPGGKDPWRGLGGVFANRSSNWGAGQGSDAGLYNNEDIHAIRIVGTEPISAGTLRDRFKAHGSPHAGESLQPDERLRILGEFPVRTFNGGVQPVDPDGNPDTSFLAKIPADVAWTFQTLDKNGMVLNMAQTWHQVRPGEIRTDCGGCHAHSQKPTDFRLTLAAKPDYQVWDLTGGKIPLLTAKQHDESGKQWDTDDKTGVRWAKGGVHNVEYFRDIKPILERSCTACHTEKLGKPAGKLVLDDEQIIQGMPGTYFRLAADNQSKFGPKPLPAYPSLAGRWLFPQATRYIRKFQSRRSLLVWKVFGERLDGWRNEDHILETVPGDPDSLQLQGQPVPNTKENLALASLAYQGSAMPPPEAVAGTYNGPDGRTIKVAPLSDEDRLTLVRWIDLGCPLDLTFDPQQPDKRGLNGWLVDDQRPTLTLAIPRAGVNAEPLSRLLVGMYDYDTGLDMDSFHVVADFAVDGIPAGTNLAEKFKPLPDGRWEMTLAQPIRELATGNLTISIRDSWGNETRLKRTFSIPR